MSLPGAALITQYFTADQRANLAVKLSNNLVHSPQDVDLLRDLLPLLDETSLDTLYPQLFDFVVHASKVGNQESLDVSVKLMLSFPAGKLREAFLSHALALLKSSINTFDFIPGLQEEAASYAEPATATSSEENSNDLLSLLQLLPAAFTEAVSDSGSDLDRVLTLFLGHRDPHLASACSKLLRWRIESIKSASLCSASSAQFYWHVIFELTKKGSSKTMAHGFVMWLRLLNAASPQDFKSNAYFQQSVISTNDYWLVLQENLAGESHEGRKFCLSILQLSLKAIGCSFNTEVLNWDMHKEKQLLTQWSKFTTLYEVLGIDTSLHQTQAAYHDILAIITPESLVHASWGFCLLATGFQASVDTVRKYSMHILFSISKENLHLLKYGLQYLEDYYLPYMMLSRHFVVRTNEGVSRKAHCKYADSFSSFIASIFTNLTTPEEVGRVSSTLLTVLVERRESFDAVRIYATFGMIKGLAGRHALRYGLHDHLLIQLFDNFSEGELFRKVVQTLNLRLLLSFQFDSLHDFASLLSKFNSFNGYEIFNENIRLVTDYLNTSAVKSLDIKNYAQEVDSVEIKVVLLRLHASMCKTESSFPLNSSGLLVSRLLESGADMGQLSGEILSELISSALNVKETEDVYLSLGNSPSSLQYDDSLSVQKIWDSIIEDSHSADYGVLRMAYAKFHFLTKLLEERWPEAFKLDLEAIFEFSNSLFCNSADCARNVTSFYKLKDSMCGELQKLLSIYVSKFPQNCHLSSVIPIISFDSGNSKTLGYICDTLKILLDEKACDDESLLITMCSLLDAVGELDADRFKLTDRDLHVKLINLMLHDVMITTAAHVELIGEMIMAFSETIIFNSYGRRGLMTTLVKALSNFQVRNPDKFEKLEFLPNFLVKAFSQRELQSSAYKIEALVGDLYDSNLAPSPDSHIFTEVYGVDEVASKVWLLAMINSIKSSECSERILEHIFSEEVAVYTVHKPSDGVAELYRVQVSKIVISLIGNLEATLAIELYLDKFINLVETDPSPQVRVYFEWAIALLLLAEPQFSSKIYEKLEASIEDHEMKPILVIAYERIIFLMIQSMDTQNAEKYLAKFITILVSAASTNKAVTRHFSMSLAISVHEEIRKKNLNIDQGLYHVIANMYKSARSTDAYGQFKSGDAYLWNITHDFNLVNISGSLLLRLQDREVDFLTEKDFDFLSMDQKRLLNRPIGKDQSNLWVAKLKEASKTSLKESSAGVVSPLQTKSGAWSSIMDVDETARGADVKRSELIVVASLVDKPPNLGGICRLCDVLGAGLLTLHDLKVKQSQQFKSVSVTADYWMPMAEVKADNLVEFLRSKKRDGYTLIGLEQTDKSVVLDAQLKFPKRSLLLLGREKEGIPGELLAELDFCVEIKQVGVVRSMNIQTATAVVVHAYSSQNC